jgi:hypothetical protein
MSLLKLRRTVDKNTRPMDDVFIDFTLAVDTYIENSNDKTLADMVKNYSEYGYLYLYKTSRTLKSDNDAKDRMTYMNSIIAEACREQDVPYFSSTGGYSVIDKAVAYVVDNGIQNNISYVLDIFEELQKSKEEQ